MILASVLFALISFSFAEEVEDPDVVVLTEENFSKVATNTPLMLVEFYAPWCGHCKRLAPEYAVAATELKREDPPIVLAKVDATVETSLAEKYGVSGYPTLKVMRNGIVSEYGGPRDANGIVKYMKSISGPAAKLLESADALDAFTSSDEPVFVLFAPQGGDAESKFLIVANQMREDLSFAIAADGALAKAAGVSQPALVAYRPASFESTKVVYDGAFDTSDALKAFVLQRAVPLAGVYSRDTAKLYSQIGLPRVVVWTRVDPGKNDKQVKYYLNRLKKVAAGYEGKALFTVEDKSAPQFNEMNFDSNADFGLGAVSAMGQKFKSDVSKFSVDALNEFAQAFVNGDVPLYVKSEPVPSEQGDVVQVVGTTFDEIVHNPNKDVLIEFYAPWCGHCKSLAPVYDDLGKAMSKYSDTLTIAKIDATANDVPPKYEVRGFPTIVLVKNNGEEHVSYDGARDLKSMKKWLRKNVSRPLGGKAKDEL